VDVVTTITQADREAAAAAAVLVEMRDLILAGRADHHAEPFARHRIAAEQAEHEAVVKWLAQAVKREQRSPKGPLRLGGMIAYRAAMHAIWDGEHRDESA
jgi:hypothetical protein